MLDFSEGLWELYIFCFEAIGLGCCVKEGGAQRWFQWKGGPKGPEDSENRLKAFCHSLLFCQGVLP